MVQSSYHIKKKSTNPESVLPGELQQPDGVQRLSEFSDHGHRSDGLWDAGSKDLEQEKWRSLIQRACYPFQRFRLKTKQTNKQSWRKR